MADTTGDVKPGDRRFGGRPSLRRKRAIASLPTCVGFRGNVIMDATVGVSWIDVPPSGDGAPSDTRRTGDRLRRAIARLR